MEHCASYDSQCIAAELAASAQAGVIVFQKAKPPMMNASCVPRSPVWAFNKDCVSLFVLRSRTHSHLPCPLSRTRDRGWRRVMCGFEG
jgi:hypothetical protein